MKLKDLKCLIFKLTHITDREAEALFTAALKTSLLTLYNDLLPTRRRSIFLNPVKRLLYQQRTVVSRGEAKTLPLLGRAYSMRLSGSGRLTFIKGSERRLFTFDTKDLLIRDFIDGEGEIELSTDKIFTVYDFSLFELTDSESAEDIPYGRSLRTVDLSGIPDLLEFALPPEDGEGNTIIGSYFEDKRLFLPVGYSGEVRLIYLRKPEIPRFDDEELNIPEILEPPLILLLSSRMLTELDPELSLRYESLYKETASALRRKSPSYKEEFVVTDGWA